jgi:hypothetical protein
LGGYVPVEHDSGNTWVNDFGYLTRTETQKKDSKLERQN